MTEKGQRISNDTEAYPTDKHIKELADDSDGYTFESWSSTYISVNDENPSVSDILDLDKMADAFEERKKVESSKKLTADDMKKYIILAEADFDMIRHTDKYLKETYDFYFEPALDHAPHVKRDTMVLIDRLLKQPHFYCPGEREETTDQHVTRWLTKYTANQEREMNGLESRDPYEPVRFVDQVEPRLSTSETNIVIGNRKRKRDVDADDKGDVFASSSDSRLDRHFARRPRKIHRIT